jgi:hypothetical protein
MTRIVGSLIERLARLREDPVDLSIVEQLIVRVCVPDKEPDTVTIRVGRIPGVSPRHKNS